MALAFLLRGCASSCGGCYPAVVSVLRAPLLCCQGHAEDTVLLRAGLSTYKPACYIPQEDGFPVDIEKLMFSVLSPWQAVEGASDHTWG